MIAGIFVSKKMMKLSQAVLPMMAFSILSCDALGQNSTMSFMTEVNDGIAISNFLAMKYLPEDGWLQEMFLSKYNQYI